MIKYIGCTDSATLGEQRKSELDIPRHAAAELGRTAVAAADAGYYHFGRKRIEWLELVQAAIDSKISVAPDDPLPPTSPGTFASTRVEVTNETTLAAAKRLTESGLRTLALNFANGVYPGGGFLNGARAQEECLCRSSALYMTLVGDVMYDAHKLRPRPDSTDWAILSPQVPIFRNDRGEELEAPWLLDFITCAAPYEPTIGQPDAGDLLQRRIHRVLDIARAYDYPALVLGAWGCGAFGNDADRTARDFRSALENEFRGAFSDVIFAIADWSSNRRFLKPFASAFKC